MRKQSAKHAKKQLFSAGSVYRAAGILFILTLFSMRLVSGMLAKYTASDTQSDQARTAGMASAALYEHKAELQNGIYVLDRETIVSSNQYAKVIPGTDIPKDPYIQLDGKNEVACVLYVEICTDQPDAVSWQIGTDFTKVTGRTGPNNGWLYQYQQPIPPHTEKTVSHILTSDKITVSESYKDITSPAPDELGGFEMDIHAYLVQID